MYSYVTDKKFLSNMRKLCGEIMQSLCHNLKQEYNIGSKFYLVGSGAKNLIMQNASESIDLDYNLEIVRCEDFYDCRYLKECAQKAFDMALRKRGFKNCEDSKSSLTSKQISFKRGNQTPFSIDVCITRRDNNDNYYRLIHEKTSSKDRDKYYWNMVQNFSKIKEKAERIKASGNWEFLKQQYLQIKKMYLQRNDTNHPSFVCYVEAVNIVYNLTLPLN